MSSEEKYFLELLSKVFGKRENPLDVFVSIAPPRKHLLHVSALNPSDMVNIWKGFSLFVARKIPPEYVEPGGAPRDHIRTTQWQLHEVILISIAIVMMIIVWPNVVMDCGELEELGEVVAGGEDQHRQDVTDESALVMTMV